jgi:hypothetical protein
MKRDRKEYNRNYQTMWRNKHREQYRERAREWARKKRREAIEHYGGKCECCGETTFEFLAIDHIDGGGAKHRKTISGSNVGRWLVSRGFPKGFRVLCYNCNQARQSVGICPHQLSRVGGWESSKAHNLC